MWQSVRGDFEERAKWLVQRLLRFGTGQICRKGPKRCELLCMSCHNVNLDIENAEWAKEAAKLKVLQQQLSEESPGAGAEKKLEHQVSFPFCF